MLTLYWINWTTITLCWIFWTTMTLCWIILTTLTPYWIKSNNSDPYTTMTLCSTQQYENDGAHIWSMNIMKMKRLIFQLGHLLLIESPTSHHFPDTYKAPCFVLSLTNRREVISIKWGEIEITPSMVPFREGLSSWFRLQNEAWYWGMIFFMYWCLQQ
jgi:hypothetical protein